MTRRRFLKGIAALIGGAAIAGKAGIAGAEQVPVVPNVHATALPWIGGGGTCGQVLVWTGESLEWADPSPDALDDGRWAVSERSTWNPKDD